MSLLELSHVTKRFGGNVAVDDVSLSFDAGVVCGLIGPNGSGKTTLTNLVSQLYALDGGSIQLGGERLERRSPYEMASLGVVRTFQMPKMFGTMTVLDNVLTPVVADHRKELLTQVRGRAHGVIAQVGLDHLIDLPASALSGGQVMLLQLARALMHEPVRVLLMDEPFAGVAPAIKERMIAVIHHLNVERGALVILISHEMTTVRRMCSQVCVMNTGRVIASGTLDDVARRPEVVEAYLGRPI